MKKSFPYSRQYINNKDIQKVIKVLKSDYLTQGPEVKKFESKFKDKVNSKYAISASSATSGLHLACLALKLNKGDFLWTVPNSFVASANCGLYCNAEIDFVDIDNETFNIDIKLLKNKLYKAKKKKKLPKILVVVHMGGSPADLQSIKKLSNTYKFKIIEDASHALGAKLNNFPVGSCKWSDIAVFSLHPVKIITSAEGGMITTNSKEIFKKISILKNHGITRDKKILKKKIDDFWYYEQKMLGYNYRLSDLNCSLANSQIDRLNFFVKKRNRIAKFYINKLNSINLKFQKILSNSFSSYHLFIIQFNKINSKKKYSKVFNEFRKNNIMVNLHYLPIHLQPYYRKLGFSTGQFKNSESYALRSFSFPIYPQLKNSELNFIVKKINKISEKYDLL